MNMSKFFRTSLSFSGGIMIIFRLYLPIQWQGLQPCSLCHRYWYYYSFYPILLIFMKSRVSVRIELSRLATEPRKNPTLGSSMIKLSMGSCLKGRRRIIQQFSLIYLMNIAFAYTFIAPWMHLSISVQFERSQEASFWHLGQLKKICQEFKLKTL